MKILTKVKKALTYFVRYDVIQSLKWYFKLKLPQSASFHIYPNSIVDIQKGAIVDIQKGEFAINASWFETRRRRYVSELRVLKEGKLIVEGNFALYQGASIHVGEGAKLILHGNSILNTNSTINCFERIEIGSGCAISDNVCIHDSDSHILNGERDKVTASVKIEDMFG